jgi:hypothetical protein
MTNQVNLVVPGAIWARTDAKSKGRRSTILLVANQHLSGRLALEFPPMVTYQDDKGNINTVTEERFTSNRAFYDMDDVVMANVQRLLSVEVEEEEDDDEDDGSLSLVEDGGLAEGTADRGKIIKQTVEVIRRPDSPEVVEFEDEESSAQMVLAQVQDTEPTEVTVKDVEELPHPQLDAIFISNNATYPQLAPELLESSVVQYEQEPILTEDGLGLRHKVLVFMNQGLDIEALNTAFDPEVDNYYSSFKINNVVVNWDSYLGAWPVIATDGVYASLVFTTDPVRTAQATGEAVNVVEEIHMDDTPEQVIEKMEHAGITTPALLDPQASIQQSPVEIVNVVEQSNEARVEAGLAPVAAPTQQVQPAQVVQVPPPVSLNVVSQGQMAYAQPATTPMQSNPLDILGDTALTVPPTIVTQG